MVGDIVRGQKELSELSKKLQQTHEFDEKHALTTMFNSYRAKMHKN